jgi:dTDP-4-amino-4,6-dideoxygalactose transaminase
MFEENVAEYAGAPYAVAVDNCTDALFLCLRYMYRGTKGVVVRIPRRTYLSVPQAIIHAGFPVVFEDILWSGVYQLKPLPIFDGATRFRRGMYEGGFHCLSFHWKKHLHIGKGGMILTDSSEAVDWLKRARYEGRQEGVPYTEDPLSVCGWNMYLLPEQAARGMLLLMNMPDDNPDLQEDYGDLSQYEIFKGGS